MCWEASHVIRGIDITPLLQRLDNRLGIAPAASKMKRRLLSHPVTRISLLRTLVLINGSPNFCSPLLL